MAQVTIFPSFLSLPKRAGPKRLGSPRAGLLSGADPGIGRAALVLLLVAVAVRCLQFGNPLVHVDEQFYLLVGGRIWQGALPYVDIWDRKPVGLFLLFALFRAGGSDGVLAYQLTATLCLWLTALLLFRMACRIAPRGGALAAGILYILWFNLAGGEGGQSPVYYNLPVAAAMMFLLRAHDRARHGHNDYARAGLWIMLLFGIALQIKYSALFEGIFAGMALLVLSWRNGATARQLAGNAVLWVGCALAPTLVAAAFYWHVGHLGEWWFANFQSILLRQPQPPDIIPKRIGKMAQLMVPFLLAIPLRRWLGCRPEGAQARFAMAFLDAWAASALLGVILFGTWFDHYALPLFAPFSVIAAPIWRHRMGRAGLCLMMIVSLVIGQRMIFKHQSSRGNARELAGAVASLQGMQNCPFVYSGFIALYDAGHACMPTTRSFPSHLRANNERGATGIDQVAEVRHILALQPDRIMVMEPGFKDENPITRAMLYAALNRHYRPVFRFQGRKSDYVVYGRIGTIPPSMQEDGDHR